MTEALKRRCQQATRLRRGLSCPTDLEEQNPWAAAELWATGPIPKSGDAPKSTGVRYAKGRRPNNTGDWQLGKSPLWKCFWSRKSKWAGTRKREEESVSVPTALRHPRQPPSRTRRDGC